MESSNTVVSPDNEVIERSAGEPAVFSTLYALSGHLAYSVRKSILVNMDGLSRELSNEASFWILVALSDAPKHGYAILRDVEQMSASQGRAVSLKVPTLYGALERLNRSDLIAVVGEEVVDGRARRYYRVTDGGAAALSEETGRLEARARAARSAMSRASVSSSIGVGDV